jgi:hypothetical protein
VGFTFAQGREIWQGHPDRILAVMESFIERSSALLGKIGASNSSASGITV